MKKFNVLLLLIVFFRIPQVFHAQQTDRPYRSFASTDRIYAITEEETAYSPAPAGSGNLRTANSKNYTRSSYTDRSRLSTDLSFSPAMAAFIGYNSIPTHSEATFASNSNDGVRSATAPIPFSADLYISTTDGVSTYAPGSSTSYTMIVGNNGPFGVQGATVSVPLPSEIPAANITYTAVFAGGATSSVTEMQTGAVTDAVNLPMNSSVTYNITVNIPVTYTGNLNITATVTAPANGTDPNTVNNTATDTNVQSVCYNPVTNTDAGIDTRVGITLQKNPNVGNSNWPFSRKSAHMVIESNTQGFVVTRMETAALSNITHPKEGMIVFDTTVKCLKIYSDGAWKCFSVPACP